MKTSSLINSFSILSVKPAIISSQSRKTIKPLDILETLETLEPLEFNIDNYYSNLEKNIKKILSRKENDNLTYDILDTEKSKANKLMALKEKHRQMKIGEIWQETLGSYNEFINLKQGSNSGLDIISHSRKIAIELKNRTNTDNSSSKKANLDKLAKFKSNNPDYTCIYANINDTSEKKTLTGFSKNLVHNGENIEQMVGYKFLKYILQEDTDNIIEFIKNLIDSQ